VLPGQALIFTLLHLSARITHYDADWSPGAVHATGRKAHAAQSGSRPPALTAKVLYYLGPHCDGEYIVKRCASVPQDERSYATSMRTPLHA
jgi:hypothetical protein